MDKLIRVKHWFSKESFLANSPWILIVLCFALFTRKAAFNWPMGIMAITGAVLLFQNFSSIKSNNALKWFLILFLCIWIPLLVSLPDAVNSRSWGSAGRYILYPLLAIFIIYNLTRKKNLQTKVFYGVAFLAIFLCVDALFQYFVGYNVFGYKYDGVRLLGMFTPKSRMATLATLSPFVFELTRRHGMQFKVLWLAPSLFLVVMILTSIASAWYMFAFSCIGYGIFLIRMYSWRRLINLGLLAFVLTIVFSYGAYQIPQVKIKIDKVATMFKGDYKSMEYASAYRISLWITAWNMGRSHYINGVGPRGYRFAYFKYAGERDFFKKQCKLVVKSECKLTVGFPHQTALEIFAETGLIGVLAYLLFWIFLFRYFRANKQVLYNTFPWLLSLIVAMNPVNAYMGFYSHYWSSFCMLLLACFFAFSQKPEEQTSIQPDPS